MDELKRIFPYEVEVGSGLRKKYKSYTWVFDFYEYRRLYMSVNEKVIEWLRENNIDHYHIDGDLPNLSVWFKTPVDAIRFKLVWGSD